MAKKLTNEEFIDKANQKHNGKYNYSKTIYKNKRTNVIITCPIHGDFEQNPEVHLRGSGCPKCGKSISSNKRLKPKETIIEEFKKTHGDKYDYSLVDYKGTDTKVKIICPAHGVFLQTPYEHKKGSGCPVCNNRNKTTEDFIKKAIEIHGNKYDYSEAEYINATTKIKIVCPIHGVFLQDYKCHITQKQNCPKCSLNFKGEEEIRNFAKKNNIILEEQKTFEDLKDKRLLKFDFYNKEKNLCIEFDGKQHFEPIFGDKSFKETQEHDKLKNAYCKENNINLLRMPYWDFYKINGILSNVFKINNINNQDIKKIKKNLGDFPFNKYKESILFNDYQNLCNGNYRDKAGTGNYIIKHFFNNIWSSKVGNKPSPLEAWYNNDLIEQVIKNRLIYSKPPYTKEKIKYGLYVSKIAPKVSVFNPNLAKRLIRTYLNEFDTILDPFSGFGGRLLGVCSIGKKYIGFDINEQMVKNGNDVISFFKLNATITKKDVFENFGEYDCLLTCPPYNLKETWGEEIKDLNCDEWIDICLKNFKCKKYLFIVDDTKKYKNNIVEEITNNSHLGTNTEKVILI